MVINLARLATQARNALTREIPTLVCEPTYTVPTNLISIEACHPRDNRAVIKSLVAAVRATPARRSVLLELPVVCDTAWASNAHVGVRVVRQYDSERERPVTMIYVGLTP